METVKFSDLFGVYTPIILFITSLFLLRNIHIYLRFFIYGTILNNILNILLKLIIKEPRPNQNIKSIEIGIVNEAQIGFDKFGMPSGHAQNEAYYVSFITLVLKSPFISFIYVIIALLSLFQRYLHNNHTFLQLIIGWIIGSIFGYFTYIIANKFITGDTTIKKDNNAPL